MKSLNKTLIFQTNLGDLEFELFSDKAPQTIEQLKKLSEKNAFEGVSIFRIIPGSVVQFHDVFHKTPLLKPEELSAFKFLPVENKMGKFEKGSLALARNPENENTGHSSISIQLKTQSHLNGQYTLFGKLVKSDAVIEQIQKIPLKGETPLFEVKIVKTLFLETELAKKNYKKSTPKEVIIIQQPQSMVAPTQNLNPGFAAYYNSNHSDLLLLFVLLAITLADFFMRTFKIKTSRIFISISMLCLSILLLLQIPKEGFLNSFGMIKSTLSLVFILFSIWELSHFENPLEKK